MTPIDTQPIRRRADGSIDTRHHMQRGRRLRSEQAHRLLALAGIAPRCPDRTASFWRRRRIGAITATRTP